MELDERIYKEKVISFKKGLPGLENLHEYVLLTPDDLYPIYILQSVKEPGILLPVINPFDIDENYKAPIGKRDFEELNIADYHLGVERRICYRRNRQKVLNTVSGNITLCFDPRNNLRSYLRYGISEDRIGALVL
jgi:hypothetical protein